MAKWVKVFALKSDDPSSSPGPTRLRERIDSGRLSSALQRCDTHTISK